MPEVRNDTPTADPQLGAEDLAATSILANDGWLRWNEETWGLEAHRVRFGGASNGPVLDGVVYTSRNGRVRMPPRNPYLPFRFTPSATTREERRTSQWLALAAEMAELLKSRGLRGAIALPPGILDARPFQWAGFVAGVQYTFLVSLPFEEGTSSGSIRKNLRKAKRLGLSVTQSDDWSRIHTCLAATEEAKGFSHRTPPTVLARLAHLLGEEHFRAYLTALPSGEPASALLQLHTAGGTLIDWSAGTLREHLSTGSVQLTYRHAIQAAEQDGATEFDFVGANIPSVAKAKAEWGASVVPYLTLEAPGARSLAKEAIRTARWLLPTRNRKAAR